MPDIPTMFSLAGKVAFVTGAARGLGRVCALALAQAGADVAVADLKSEAVEPVADEIRRHGRRALALGTDVTDSDQVTVMVQRIIKELGSPDIALNNAGICVHAAAEAMTDDEWRRVVDVDLTGVFHCARAAGRAMIAAGRGGRIINTASMSGRIVNRPQNQCSYNSAKAGVIHLTRSLACEWARHGITVNSISPGYTATEMTLSVPELHPAWLADSPMGRLARPEEIAPAVVFLASPGASYVSGHDLVIDGAFSCW